MGNLNEHSKNYDPYGHYALPFGEKRGGNFTMNTRVKTLHFAAIGKMLRIDNANKRAIIFPNTALGQMFRLEKCF